MDPNDQYTSLPQRLAEPSLLSRTPSRRQQFTDQEINPLLSNLSPSSTLEALARTDAVSPEKRHRQSFIQKSVAAASTSERKWGIKAALAGKKVRQWFEELSGWPWPGYDGRSLEGEEYWGSLPARVVQAYEERIEVIRDDMETLEVEDLKNYVRNSHSGYSARRSSVSSNTAEYEHLDDFLAIITATIIQALPTLSRLNSLLNTWSTRLLILHQLPAFHADFSGGRIAMESAWNAVGTTDNSMVVQTAGLSRKVVEGILSVLQEQINQLGRRLDNMLDLLEGSKDTLPEQWIDGMDSLETEYSMWVVKTKELVLQHEMDLLRKEEAAPHNNASVSSHDDTITKAESTIPSVDFNHENGSVRRGTEAISHNRASAEPIQSFDNSLTAPEKDLEKGSQLASKLSNPGSPDDHAPSEPVQKDAGNPQAFRSDVDHLEVSKSSHRPAPLTLTDRIPSANSTVSSTIRSDTSRPGSAISDYSSNKSSPEIRKASIVEYIASPALISNPWSEKEITQSSEATSRRWSSQTARETSRSSQPGPNVGTISPTSQRSRASTVIHAPSMNGDPGRMPAESLLPGHYSRARSASTQSFDPVPKYEVRQVDIRRSGSYSAMPITNHQPSSANETRPSDPPSFIANDIEAQVPTADVDVISERNLPIDQPYALSIDASDAYLNQDLPQPPQNGHALQPKDSHKTQHALDSEPGLNPTKTRRQATNPIQNQKSDIVTKQSPHTQPLDFNDRLEARISSILQTIPANIRLTSSLHPPTPETPQSSTPSKPPSSRPKIFRMRRAQTAHTPPTLTLAPAAPKSFKTSSIPSDPEVKLYHLHQPGKDVPIKLFVRLVGEAGERVMVRIGGGWADLGEYLKEYASHHGRRSVSDTRFDIQGFPSSPASAAGSPASRPGTSHSAGAISAPLFKRQQTTPAKFVSPQQQQTPVYGSPPTPYVDTDSPSPSLGLAGPKTKNIDISPKKQAWVDELMEQAKGGSGAGNGNGNGLGVGDIGKVGGIKRVFLKNRSRRGSNV